MTISAAPRIVTQQPVAPVVGAVLLTPEQLAERLAVPITWIREKTRERARIRDTDPLPVVRLGKYIRFRWSDVEAWLNRQTT
jgi:excisionase family DNA binding protein